VRRTSIKATDERLRTTDLNNDSILKDHDSFWSDYRAHADKKKLNDNMVKRSKLTRRGGGGGTGQRRLVVRQVTNVPG
jgi:hypothetical protein